jgi:hypothetical protein
MFYNKLLMFSFPFHVEEFQFERHHVMEFALHSRDRREIVIKTAFSLNQASSSDLFLYSGREDGLFAPTGINYIAKDAFHSQAQDRDLTGYTATETTDLPTREEYSKASWLHESRKLLSKS